MSLPKLELSRNITSKVISNCIKARKSKSTEQYDCKLFFRLDSTWNSTVELFNWMGRLDFDLTIKFDALMGEEYYEWSCLWYQSRFRHKTGWLHTFLSFLLETSRLQSAVYSKWKHFCLTLQCCWIHWE